LRCSTDVLTNFFGINISGVEKNIHYEKQFKQKRIWQQQVWQSTKRKTNA